MPPTWSGCQCVISALDRVIFSDVRMEVMELIHSGFPSPVSRRMRVRPVPRM